MNKYLCFLFLSWLMLVQSTQAQNLHPFRSYKGKWGYKDEFDQVKIKPRYHKAEDFNQGLAVVSRHRKYGVIDMKGKWVLKNKYTAVTILNSKERLFRVKLKRKTRLGTTYEYGVVGTNNKVYLSIVYAQLTPVSLKQPALGVAVSKGEKFALYTYKGKALTGFDYDKIYPADYTTTRILAKKRGKYGYLDQNGREVIPFVYTKAQNFAAARAKVVRDRQRYEIDDMGKILPNEPIHSLVTQSAKPVIGFLAYRKYINNNLRYPKFAHRTNVAGRVIVRMVVEKNGYLSNIKIVQGIGAGCDQEAVRVIKNSPRWIPGKLKGKPVRSMLYFPIVFQLE